MHSSRSLRIGSLNRDQLLELTNLVCQKHAEISTTVDRVLSIAVPLVPWMTNVLLDADIVQAILQHHTRNCLMQPVPIGTHDESDSVQLCDTLLKKAYEFGHPSFTFGFQTLKNDTILNLESKQAKQQAECLLAVASVCKLWNKVLGECVNQLVCIQPITTSLQPVMEYNNFVLQKNEMGCYILQISICDDGGCQQYCFDCPKWLSVDKKKIPPPGKCLITSSMHAYRQIQACVAWRL